MIWRSLRAQFIDALSASATRQTPELKPEKRDMAWKRLRPFISRRMLNSLCYGFSVSVLRATVFGIVLFTVLYFYYKTKLNCQLDFIPRNQYRLTAMAHNNLVYV